MKLDIIHVSEIYNRNSIQKNGIMPTKVKLLNHLEYFNEHGLVGDKVIYAWKSCEKDNKFIRDQVFCKTFLHPRNDIAEKYDDDRYYDLDFSGLLKTNLYKYDSMLFDVYKTTIDIDDFDFCDVNCVHLQFPDQNKFSSIYAMNDKYSHDDKELVILDDKILDFEIIKQASFSFEKHGKYNIKVI